MTNHIAHPRKSPYWDKIFVGRPKPTWTPRPFSKVKAEPELVEVYHRGMEVRG